MLEKDKPAGSVIYTAPSGAKVTAIPSKYHARMLRVAIRNSESACVLMR